MRLRMMPLVVYLVAGWGGVAAAQVPDWVNRLLVAAELPIVVLQARQEGVSDADLRTALAALVAKDIPAADARDLFEEERVARRDHGPVGNFGAFVQQQLDAGLRGRDLAAAIREEHARRGIGGGNAAAKPGSEAVNGRGNGRPGMAADTAGRGRSAKPGNSGKGKGASAGRPETHGTAAKGKGKPPVAASKGKPPAGASTGHPGGRPDKPNF